MRMVTKRLVCLPLGASPLLLSMYQHRSSPKRAVTEGLDAEADAVGPGIYGGRVERDEADLAPVHSQDFTKPSRIRNRAHAHNRTRHPKSEPAWLSLTSAAGHPI